MKIKKQLIDFGHKGNKKSGMFLTCTPKVRQKTFGVLLCLKSTGNMAMQND